MRAEALNNVGKSILSSGNADIYSFSISKNICGFRTSFQNKNKEICIDSNMSNEYGSIISSISDKKPILIFRPNLGETFLEISMSCDDFLKLDTQFTQPIVFKQIPFKVHAECVNNKSLLSIETTKFISYSDFLKGMIFVKYGKSLDFNVDIYLPNNESHLLIDSSQITFNNSLGVHNSPFNSFSRKKSSLPFCLSSFFVTYKLCYDYLSVQKQIGLYAQSNKKLNTLSILYNLNQKEVDLKAETNVNPGLSFATSAGLILNTDKKNEQNRFKLINFKIGTSFLPHDRFNSKCNLQFTIPSNEVTAKLQTVMKHRFLVNASTTFSFLTKSFGVGLDIVCNSNE